MAELLLKVKDRSNRPGDLKDGDPIDAFTDRRILCVHAEHAANLRSASRLRNGLIDSTDPYFDLLSLTCKYQFRQVSRHTVERTDLTTSDTTIVRGPEFAVSIQGGPERHVAWEDIAGSPLRPEQSAVVHAAMQSGIQLPQTSVVKRRVGNSSRLVIKLTSGGVDVPFQFRLVSPEHMFVEEFLRKQRRSQNHRLFEVGGQIVWFDKRIPLTDQIVSDVWDKVEQKTPYRRTERHHGLWPFGRFDIRSHLAVRVDALTEEEAEDMVTPQLELDDNGDPVWELEDEDEVFEHIGDVPPDERPWQRSVVAKRKTNINWRRDLLGDINEREQDVDDPYTPVGVDVPLGNGKFRHESKDQPLQSDRRRFEKKPNRRSGKIRKPMRAKGKKR